MTKSSSLIILLLLCATYLVATAVSAFSHDWYDDACCNDLDCRPISGTDASGVQWSEIEQTAEGYRWTSSKTRAVHVFREADRMPSGEPRIRPSRDGRFHGCETEGSYGLEHAPPFGICLYVPSFF